MKILVTGGAGYIGSHVSRLLVEQGHNVTIVDLLRARHGTGNRWAVPKSARLVEGDCGSSTLLESLLPVGERFDVVFHFAASIVIEESIKNPILYYENNVSVSLRLFQYAVRTGVPAIIFSSTGATYGELTGELVREDDEQRPISPYGSSKKMCEGILRDLCSVGPKTKFVGLRYFNPAGAHSSLEIGQARPLTTHVVNIAAEAALGVRSQAQIFGTDYPTPDGTCLRDFIHIEDLTEAHVAALDYLQHGGVSEFFNVGYGRPYSVREVFDTMKSVTGVDFTVVESPRRPGDPARLAADPAKIRRVLGWKPRHDSIEESLRSICDSQFRWEKRRRAEKL